MKYLIFSDLHLHNWNYGASFKKNGWNSRLLAQFNVGKQIYNSAVEHNVDSVFFLGDLFHTHGKIDSHSLTIASSILHSFTVDNFKLYVLIGNHDMANREGSIHSLSWAPGYLIDRPLVIDKFSLCPYTTNKEIVEHALFSTPKDGFCFLHQGVSGIPVGSDFVIPNEILSEDMIPSHVRHVFTGHYHKPKRVNDNLTVVGSPMEHNWGDSDGFDRGWWIYDTDSNNLTFFPSKAPRFVTVNEKNIENVEVRNNYVRAIGFPIEEQNHIRNFILGAGALSIEFKTNKVDFIEQCEAKSFNLEDVIHLYEKTNDLSKDVREIGKKLREDIYETPSFKS